MERLLNYFVPEHYDLALFIDKNKRKIKGEICVKGEVLNPTIKFHAKDLNISKVWLKTQSKTKTQTEIQVKTPQLDSASDALTLHDCPLGQQKIQIHFDFNLTENMQGAYISKYQHQGRSEEIVATQFESHYARECFPCVDEPAAKATFKLTITADQTDTVLSNMPAKSVTKHPKYPDKKIHSFPATPKMSSYLVAFAVGKFHKISAQTKNGIVVSTYSALNQPKSSLEFANDFAIRSLDFFEQLFDTKYPLPKLDQLALPDFESGAMENWGLVTYREQALLVNPNSAPDQRLYVATVIAHELSHQWFGNLVTMQWWDDLWLNESFATLIETYAVDKIDPTLGALDDFYEGTVLAALRRDCLPGVQAVKCEVNHPADIANIFDGAIVYAKGARLLLMLMRIMGETNFFAGIKDYFKKHAYANTVSDDLWDALSGHADFDIKSFMLAWLTQPGYPLIGSLSNQDQQRFLIFPDETSTNCRYPIREVRDDLSGHYIFNLNIQDFSHELSQFGSKSKEQKLRLLIDRSLLAKTPYVSSADLLPLIAKFQQEKEYIIWSLITLLISDLKIFLKPNSNTEQDFKNFIKDLATKQYQNLGITTKANENLNSTKLRPLILNLMAYSEDPKFAARVQQKYATTPAVDIDPSIRSSILTVVLRQTPEAQIHQTLKLYIETDDPELKSDLMLALTSIKIEAQAQNFLTAISTGQIRPQDRLYFFIRIARNQHLNKAAFAWFYQNWDKLYQEEGDKTISDYPRLLAGTIKSETSAKTFKEFFMPKIKDPALARELKIAFAEIDARLELIKTDSPAVRTELARLREE